MSSWSWDGGRWEKCCEGKVAERRRNTQEKPYTSCWLRSDLQGRGGEGRGGEGRGGEGRREEGEDYTF